MQLKKIDRSLRYRFTHFPLWNSGAVNRLERSAFFSGEFLSPERLASRLAARIALWQRDSARLADHTPSQGCGRGDR